MGETADSPGRIATLDILRGIAAMGILAMNIVAFAMPSQAYLNPAAYGLDSRADLVSWALSFVFIDGKMRGLFSLLFGASMLLVIDRAEAKGEASAAIHFRRMAWLALFGLLHFYFIWWGDILFGYAVAGMLAWFFHQDPPRRLVKIALMLLAVQFLIFAAIGLSMIALSAAAAAPDAGSDTLRQWQGAASALGTPGAAELQRVMALHQGNYGALFLDRLRDQGTQPFTNLFFFTAETLAYMLLGMAALKSGFLTGAWSNASYRKTALICLAIGVPVSAGMAWYLVVTDFEVARLFTIWGAGSVPVRPLMVIGLAALLILLTRRGGALVARIAAAGRAAFTNYLGTSILMTTLFYGYGLGLFGSMSRAELWLPVIATSALMLLWSKPWLDRFRYGPLEWLWRSLARGARQPMRRT